VWSADLDAAKFILEIDKNTYFRSAEKKRYEVIGTNQYTIPDPLYDGKWFWRVAAVDAAGNQSAWSPVGKVIVDKVITPVPTLISPDDGILTKDRVFTFTWSAETNVKLYNLQVDNDPAFPAPMRINVKPAANTFRNGAIPLGNGTWYWRVSAQGSDGIWGAFSEYHTIRVDTVKPSRPILASPANGAPAGNMPTFMWNAVPDADVVAYIIQIDKNNLFASPEKIQQQVAGTSYTPGALLADRKWFWRVRAVDAVGNIGPWSPIWRIIIDTSAPVLAEANPGS
jgi:hypothetical protein